MRKVLVLTALALSMLVPAAIPAAAENTIKLGLIAPLSGGAASIGEIAQRQLNFIAEAVNAKGGVNGEKVKIVNYDNKNDPQVSVVLAQKAVDEGVRILIHGVGSSVGAALEDFVTKYNERNPGEGVIYLNYAAIDPSLTNEKCSYWHFAFDANVDIKAEAITNFIKGRTSIKKVYLINQDYSFGHSVRDAVVRMLKEKRPDIEIVGDEFHPVVKIADFSPYIAKIKASGADSVVTSDWGQDIALLIRAAGDTGLKVDWYTFYAGGSGGPTALKQANLADRVFQLTEGVANIDYKPAMDTTRAYATRFNMEPVYYPRLFTAMDMLFKAIDEAKSDDPAKIAPKLEDMKYPSFSDGVESFMRKQDHQFFQPLYISGFGPLGPNEPFDEEHTGWGWKVVSQIPVKDTIVPTSCKMNRPM